MSRSERLLLWSIVTATLVLRALAFFRYRFDSDEQQHLHVTWGWTAGLVQYRDVFDNHAPLFHLLTAPMLALAGERSDILLWMRAPMLVLFALTLWATYAVGREVYEPRVGVWASVLLALFPPFFLKSLEYRPDNLWAPLWMVAILLLIRQQPFWAGVLLGCAMATSVKTGVLIVALVVALVISRVLRKWTPPGRWLFAAIGFAIVPAVLAIFFALSGAWEELVYCNLTFNGKVYLTRNNVWIGRAIFPFTFAAVLWTAWRFRATAHSWRSLLALIVGVYSVVLAGFWLLISPRDFLPLMPILAIFGAAVLTRAQYPVRAFAIVAIACAASLWYYTDRFENKTDWHITMMDQVLRLSHRGETLLDVKGETIFRRRPFYFAFENITRAQIARGILRDTVPEDVIRSRTYVAQADGPMWPPRARAFLSENFVNLGRLRAAGQWLREDGSFTIAIPGRYVVLSEQGIAHGVLDGVPHAGARELAAGAHRFERVSPGQSLCVVWAPSFERGHSPFHLRDLEF